MKESRKIIEIDEELCNGCGECIISCAEGALEIVDGKAKLIAEKYCDGLGACLGECPTGALKIIERESEVFDEEAVEELLAERAAKEKPAEETLPCGCPSAQLRVFDSAAGPAASPCQGASEAAPSALTHWPIQIRLVPPHAPFLKNAHLLVAADCVAPSYAGFNDDFLMGRVLLIGCPKFDDVESYVEKFTEIFKQADVQSVTTVFMEVPCCHGLPAIVRKALELSGKSIPLEMVIISVRGEVIKRQKLVA
ncbi:ATP-binding protein [Thermodesulfobacteriota bacterium]